MEVLHKARSSELLLLFFSSIPLEICSIVHSFVNYYMRNKNIYDFQAEVCKALGNPSRLQAVELLKDGELCFSEILDHIGGLKSTLSQNLSILVEVGILKVRKDSRCNYFSLKSPKAYKICQLMRELIINNIEEQTIVFSKIKSIS